MEGADESTELWRHPQSALFKLSLATLLYNLFMTSTPEQIVTEKVWFFNSLQKEH